MRRFFILSCFLFLLFAGTQGLAASPPPAGPDPFIPPMPIITVTQKNGAWNVRIGKGQSMQDTMPMGRLTHAPIPVLSIYNNRAAPASAFN
jgi:hypothetical protein